MEEADMVFSVNDPLPAYIQQGVQRLLNQQENIAQLLGVSEKYLINLLM